MTLTPAAALIMAIAWKGWPQGRPCRRAGAKRPRTFPPDHPAWTLEAHYLAHGLANWVLTLSPQRILLGGGVLRQPHLFGRFARTCGLLNGYVRATEVMRDIDQYVVPPQLEGRAGVLGGLVLEQAYTRLDRE